MSHEDGLYIVLKDEQYAETLYEILTQHIDPNNRVAYIPALPDAIYLNKNALDEENIFVAVLDKAHNVDTSLERSNYNDIALNAYRLSPDVIVTDSLENEPLKIVGMNNNGHKNPYLVDSGHNDDFYYPLDTLLNLGTRGTTVVIGVEAPDMTVAKHKVYEASHTLGKAILLENYEFDMNIFRDEKFGYWAQI